MPTKEQLIDFVEQHTVLSQEVDYNVMPGKQGVILLTTITLEQMIEEFDEDALKEAEKAGILKFINGISFVMDTRN